MKRSRFNEEEVIGILREGDSGSSVKAVCAKHNISEATYYAWKRKFGGMDVSEARRGYQALKVSMRRSLRCMRGA